MAGQYYKGTLLASPVVRGSSGDTYGTHHSVLGVGGYMEVNTLGERNSLPIDTINGIYYDGISSGQRRLGMLVNVFSENTIYQLKPNISYNTWSGYTSGQRLAALADNNNWVSLISTSNGTTASTSKNITSDYYQITHGFVVGDVLGYDGIEFVKVSSQNANSIEPLGVVTKVIDLNNFSLTYAGYIDSSAIVDYTGGTLVAGSVYYLALSGYTGKLTKYNPQGVADISKPILVALSGGNNSIVLQYRGLSNVSSSSGVDTSTFNSYTATTKIRLDNSITGATNIGFFSGNVGIQTLQLTGFPSTYNTNYYSEYNYYYRDSNGYVRMGSPTYNGILRRGYVDGTRTKSWLYNYYTGSSNQVGWILTGVDIAKYIGSFVTGVVYGTPYLNDSWNNGVTSSGSTSVFASGSLSTGGTYSVTAPVYNNVQYNEIRLRTIQSKSPTISVTYDDSFIYISGATSTPGGGGGTVGAINGLSMIGDNVSLGGTLTGSTIITMPNATQLVFLDSRTTTVGLQYAADYSSGYTARSIPDVSFVTGYTRSGPQIRTVCLPGISAGQSYQATNNDYYIGVSGGTCVTLPLNPTPGTTIIVADISCLAGLAGCCILVNGGSKYIYGYPVAEIDTKFGSMSFIYNGDNWSVISFSPALA